MTFHHGISPQDAVSTTKVSAACIEWILENIK